ncbi:MAG: inositol monophosphatase family protein, partial [Sulfitobacter sp.]
SYRPSLAYRMALVADASFDAMITLRRTWEWDIAAGTLIVAEAGGTCTTATGAPLRFNNPDPRVDGIVAGGPMVQRALIDALA